MFGKILNARILSLIALGLFCLGIARAQGQQNSFVVGGLALGGANPPANPPGLAVREGVFIKDGRPYRGVGANYFDLFLRLIRDPENKTSLQGLEKLAKAGIPFVRFAGCGFSAKDWSLYFDNPNEYFRRMDLVVRAAERNGIGLIPSLFWTQIIPDTVGEHRDQWGNPESRTIARMRQYVEDVVGRYKESPAIWAWEFGNEMNLGADLPNAIQFRKEGGTERDDLKSSHTAVALAEFAKAVRRLDDTRAIISGNSHPRASAWHNTHERSWKPDSREQFREVLLRDNPAPLDTIGIHFYGDKPVNTECAAWAKDRGEYLSEVKRIAREGGRPLFIGEFGISSEKASEAEVRRVYKELLDAMGRSGADLAAFWVYDLKSQDGSWNVTFDNARGWMIEEAVAANRAWAGGSKAEVK